MNTNRILLLSIISALVLLVYLLWSNPAPTPLLETASSQPAQEAAQERSAPDASSSPRVIATEESHATQSLPAQGRKASVGAANGPFSKTVFATNSSFGTSPDTISKSGQADPAVSQSQAQAGTEFASRDNQSEAFVPVAMSAGGESNSETDSTAQQVQMPLALVPSAPEWQPTEQQKKALKQLRDNFASAVGGPNQNPQDPAYFNRWQQALPNADQQYRQWFGDQAFMAQQYNAWVQQHPQE